MEAANLVAVVPEADFNKNSLRGVFYCANQLKMVELV